MSQPRIANAPFYLKIFHSTGNVFNQFFGSYPLFFETFPFDVKNEVDKFLGNSINVTPRYRQLMMLYLIHLHHQFYLLVAMGSLHIRHAHVSEFCQHVAQDFFDFLATQMKHINAQRFLQPHRMYRSDRELSAAAMNTLEHLQNLLVNENIDMASAETTIGRRTLHQIVYQLKQQFLVAQVEYLSSEDCLELYCVIEWIRGLEMQLILALATINGSSKFTHSMDPISVHLNPLVSGTFSPTSIPHPCHPLHFLFSGEPPKPHTITNREEFIEINKHIHLVAELIYSMTNHDNSDPSGTLPQCLEILTQYTSTHPSDPPPVAPSPFLDVRDVLPDEGDSHEIRAPTTTLAYSVSLITIQDIFMFLLKIAHMAVHTPKSWMIPSTNSLFALGGRFFHFVASEGDSIFSTRVISEIFSVVSHLLSLFENHGVFVSLATFLQASEQLQLTKEQRSAIVLSFISLGSLFREVGGKERKRVARVRIEPRTTSSTPHLGKVGKIGLVQETGEPIHPILAQEDPDMEIVESIRQEGGKRSSTAGGGKGKGKGEGGKGKGKGKGKMSSHTIDPPWSRPSSANPLLVTEIRADSDEENEEEIQANSKEDHSSESEEHDYVYLCSYDLPWSLPETEKCSFNMPLLSPAMSELNVGKERKETKKSGGDEVSSDASLFDSASNPPSPVANPSSLNDLIGSLVPSPETLILDKLTNRSVTTQALLNSRSLREFVDEVSSQLTALSEAEPAPVVTPLPLSPNTLLLDAPTAYLSFLLSLFHLLLAYFLLIDGLAEETLMLCVLATRNMSSFVQEIGVVGLPTAPLGVIIVKILLFFFAQVLLPHPFDESDIPNFDQGQVQTGSISIMPPYLHTDSATSPHQRRLNAHLLTKIPMTLLFESMECVLYLGELLAQLAFVQPTKNPIIHLLLEQMKLFAQTLDIVKKEEENMSPEEAQQKRDRIKEKMEAAGKNGCSIPVSLVYAFLSSHLLTRPTLYDRFYKTLSSVTYSANASTEKKRRWLQKRAGNIIPDEKELRTEDLMEVEMPVLDLQMFQFSFTDYPQYFVFSRKQRKRRKKEQRTEKKAENSKEEVVIGSGIEKRKRQKATKRKRKMKQSPLSQSDVESEDDWEQRPNMSRRKKGRKNHTKKQETHKTTTTHIISVAKDGQNDQHSSHLSTDYSSSGYPFTTPPSILQPKASLSSLPHLLSSPSQHSDPNHSTELSMSELFPSAAFRIPPVDTEPDVSRFTPRQGFLVSPMLDEARDRVFRSQSTGDSSQTSLSSSSFSTPQSSSISFPNSSFLSSSFGALSPTHPLLFSSFSSTRSLSPPSYSLGLLRGLDDPSSSFPFRTPSLASKRGSQMFSRSLHTPDFLAELNTVGRIEKEGSE
ncbi:hypothetical protein BLNAU_9404 [Blattamonas nauphoetae]|uniref:Uncharacterized protein n=1 Tax=Blattamonas nauphoetae TaxID=2049346 RepID=A0ABQ9XVN4_9EUKA|nr:hypothetical protein BLNAU_9404 [Blattamonas nauphoetae]